MNPFTYVYNHLEGRRLNDEAADALALILPYWSQEVIPPGVARPLVLARLQEEMQTPLIQKMARLVNSIPGLDYIYEG